MNEDCRGTYTKAPVAHLRVALLHVDALVLLAGHGLPNPDAAVAAARSDVRAGRRPRDALHLVLVPLQRCHHRPRARLRRRMKPPDLTAHHWSRLLCEDNRSQAVRVSTRRKPSGILRPGHQRGPCSVHAVTSILADKCQSTVHHCSEGLLRLRGCLIEVAIPVFPRWRSLRRSWRRPGTCRQATSSGRGPAKHKLSSSAAHCRTRTGSHGNGLAFTIVAPSRGAHRPQRMQRATSMSRNW